MKKIITIVLACCCYTANAQAPSDSYIQGIMGTGHLPGAEAVIIKDGNWVYNRSWGLADIPDNKAITQQNIFMLASISKTLIATALMQLWERGAFGLDDNINDYLPFQVHNPNHSGSVITFRMLVTHTSSIQDNYNVLGNSYVNGDSPETLDSFLRNYFVPGGSYYDSSQNFYTYRPGAWYNYSNMGATLAAYLVQRISGDDYSHYCDTAIFEKLCMGNTSYMLAGIADTTLIARPYSWNGSGYDDDGLYGYPDYPDGQLRTNITALARFMTMYMQYGIYNGTRILDSATVALMMSNQPGLNGQGIIFYKWLSSNGDTLWGHNGGDAGVCTAMYFDYKTKTGVIVLTNGDWQPANYSQIILDTLYKYGITVAPGATDTFPACDYYPESVEPVTPGNKLIPNVFPNPVNNELYIDLAGTVSNSADLIVITNIMGMTIDCSKEYSGGQIKINTSALAPGIYLVSIQNGGQKQVIKFVKN